MSDYDFKQLRQYVTMLAEHIEKLDKRQSALEDELESRVAELEQAIEDRAAQQARRGTLN